MNESGPRIIAYSPAAYTQSRVTHHLDGHAWNLNIDGLTSV